MIISINLKNYRVENIYQLEDLIKLFPEQKDYFFDLTLANPTTFKDFVSDLRTLRRVSNLFPKQAKSIIKNALLFPELFCDSYFFRNPYLDGLLNIVDLFPHEKTLIFQQTLANLETFKASVKNLKELGHVIKNFPERKYYLFNMALTDPETFKSYVNNLEDLKTIIEHFPEEKDHFFNLSLADPNDFTNFVKTLRDLESVVNLFPTQNKVILQNAMRNKDLFLTFQYSHDLVDVITHVTQQLFHNERAYIFQETFAHPKIFMDLVKHFKHLKDLIITFPEEKNYFFNLTLANPSTIRTFLNSIGALVFLIEQFPEKKDYFFKHTLVDKDFFKKNVQHFFDLETIVKLFPEQKENFFNLTLANPTEFKKLISNPYGLKEAAEIFPEHRDFIIKNALLNPYMFSPDRTYAYNHNELFFGNYYQLTGLIHIANTFPNEKNFIFQETLANPKIFNSLVNNTKNLKEVVNAFAEQKDYILKLILGDEQNFKRIVNLHEFKDFEILTKLFPEQKEYFFNLTLANPVTFKEYISRWGITEPAKIFPEQIKLILQNAISNLELFINYYDASLLFALSYLVRKFPQHSQYILQESLAQPEVFKKLVVTIEDLKRASKIFPNCAALKENTVEQALQKIQKEQIHQALSLCIRFQKGKKKANNEDSQALESEECPVLKLEQDVLNHIYSFIIPFPKDEKAKTLLATKLYAFFRDYNNNGNVYKSKEKTAAKDTEKKEQGKNCRIM